jgi:hypothetical protein
MNEYYVDKDWKWRYCKCDYILQGLT